MALPAPNEIIIEGRSIRVRGLVQGVGFRPTVWKIARKCGLEGDVLNDGAGVRIRAWGSTSDLDMFLQQLKEQAPPLSRIDSIEWEDLTSPFPEQGFHIVASEGGHVETGIVPDASICTACQDEISNPQNPRYRYPFTNCTHCGPRLSIVQALPYDRDHTSMAGFQMCPSCQGEYDDPSDRRFHAQPNSCPDCGPQAWLENADGDRLDVSGFRDAVDAAATFIRAGKIVAIKGIGGFHLACDAGNEDAVVMLRQRKHRYGKPLALMARDLEMASGYVSINAMERDALIGSESPIVVLERKKRGLSLASGVAPGQTCLGFMLPYTPLHLVLMADMQRPIVLTSGNRSEEPQVTENGEALERLSEIADLWLMNDRDIVNRLDDSVVRISAGARRTIRRARGIAPAPMILPEGFSAAPRVLAMGGALKNTFCLLGDGKAIVSQHMGDMENPRAHADYRRNMKLYRDINGFEADIIALDMHPDYIPSQWGRKLAEEANIPVVPVQHHHAHVAAVMAEHGLEKDTSPVFGIVFDGLGYGPDGDLWGGEFLIVDYAHFRRVAHFAPVPLIGGEKAMVQPWRNAFAHINAAIGWEIAAKNFKNLSLLRQFEEKPLAQVKQMLKRGLNVPPASSAGRLFDGVAAALGICFDQLSFEGEAAIGLENLALQCQDDVGGYRVAADDEISWKKLWQGILGDLDHGVSREVIARRFHNTVIQVTVHLAEKLQRTEGFSQVVLSGGVFQNNILLSEISRQLGERGMEVLSPMAFPANDGGLSLGQAAVAAARQINMERPE